eukprot:Gregarina_sp_Pseudo_9__3754@NODE_38_length_5294_cov_16_753758_g35_i0_p3_GENE_NODE_38_length_5294_cov_16_753758_g35_i0NODE_38_length_5294_cov_16_753758_g35_i0_p3_ORF_typecomplete_len379_score102_91HYLS1_C/PF15311_6/0_17HYLS1_C/PF15311_6/7_9e03_NODE_38_length_5294_cov_16_753758_g35_i01891325
MDQPATPETPSPCSVYSYDNTFWTETSFAWPRAAPSGDAAPGDGKPETAEAAKWAPSPEPSPAETRPLPETVLQQSDLFHKVPLGEKGRMELKAAIRAAMKDRPELREKVNTVAKLRCATIPQLLKIAHICDLWELALEISRRFVETRNGKQSRQAAIRKMTKSGCLLQDRRLPPGLCALPVSAQTMRKPPRLMSKTSAPPHYADFRPPDPTAANTPQQTTPTGSAEESAATWALREGSLANSDPPYNHVTEWQALDQPYYDMYGAGGMYTPNNAPNAAPASQQWINANSAPQSTNNNYYPQTSAPPEAAAASNTCSTTDLQYNARVDGVCLFTIDQTHALMPSSTSTAPMNENPAVEQLAAISQFGLWAAEATPGFV